MVVNKEDLKKKLLRAFTKDEHKERCPICNEVISLKDIKNGSFEYTKSACGERYIHSGCIKK